MREKQAVMPQFELWQCVNALKSEKNGVYGRKRKKWQVYTSQRRELVEAREGTNESRGLRDNLWEGKSGVAICLDHRACCALLIPLQLSWSAHTLSIYRDKTPPELSAADPLLHPAWLSEQPRA